MNTSVDRWATLARLYEKLSDLGPIDRIGKQLDAPAQAFVYKMEQRSVHGDGDPRLSALGILNGVRTYWQWYYGDRRRLPDPGEWSEIAERYDHLPRGQFALLEEVGVRTGDPGAQNFVNDVYAIDVERGRAGGGDLGATHTLAVALGVMMADRYLKLVQSQG